MNKNLENNNLIALLIRFSLENKPVVFLSIILMIGWGILVAPFDWSIGNLPRNPVPVDAIPDIGENQQIVFTSWKGRSPRDIEDQISYPLTVSLLGVPGVKSVRSYSMFGFSSIYIIFNDNVDFYWSRSRVLEKLNSLPPDTLPEGVKPSLGPDATALGQVFWYTLEGRDEAGNPTGGWGLEELRSIQDWQVRYALMSAEGISEVSSIGGFQKEYQIDVDPDALQAFGVSIQDVTKAIQMSNIDVGAKTIEVNKAEYVIRGLGFIKSLEDIENSVIRVVDNVPVSIKNVAQVSIGPALRRGALDKEGTEAVGGVAVVRYGENPLEAIQNLKKRIGEISLGLPKKTLPDGSVSQVTIVPFYDRTGLIKETLTTLKDALTDEILITTVVVLVLVLHLKSSFVISSILPVGVLMSFCAMKTFGVDANIVALSGIAIAIGTMVDMGIVLCENVLRRLEEEKDQAQAAKVVYKACVEVGSAVVTAVATTIISFLPIFTMEAAEGKLFKPLAWTKTYALLASILLSLTVLPVLIQILFASRIRSQILRKSLFILIGIIGLSLSVYSVSSPSIATHWKFFLVLVGLILIFNSGFRFWYSLSQKVFPKRFENIFNVIIAFVLTSILSRTWAPLGIDSSPLSNFLFVSILIASVLLGVYCLNKWYENILAWCLENKLLFIIAPFMTVFFGLISWLGIQKTFEWLPNNMRHNQVVEKMSEYFPGMKKEFMPSLDEGSYLYMPTTMPHASIGESMDAMRKQDLQISSIPEVESVVGKIGRVDSALDPAPISMVETIINYHPEFLTDENGGIQLFEHDKNKVDFVTDLEGNKVIAPDGEPYKQRGVFKRDPDGLLIPSKDGIPFRLWRPALNPKWNVGRTAWTGITKPDDIWNEIVKLAEIPGSTSAPKLQPIAARLVMLQSGMRAPMGIKVKGPDLETIESFGLELEKHIKNVDSVNPLSVFADRIVGKPYIEIDIDREAIARYGIKLSQVQEVIESGIGGKKLTTTVEGRERYPVRVRYQREFRDQIEYLDRILIQAPDGTQIPLKQLATIQYQRGPQNIKSEDTFLIGYVLFDMKEGNSEVTTIKNVQDYLSSKIKSGELSMPAGVSFTYAGNYENQVRSEKRLMIVLPISLLVIFVVLYLQFKSTLESTLVFTGIIVAWAGGFIMLWLYSQGWFLDINLFGNDIRELFQVRPFNLSVAVWVGFLALFGIASDDGVIMTTYLKQKFRQDSPSSITQIRKAVIEAGKRRSRPCLMTSATTILALLPVLTSSGKGSDIMVPMAIPTFGGMIFVGISMFVVPVIYSSIKEFSLRTRLSDSLVCLISISSFFLIPIAVSSKNKFRSLNPNSNQNSV